MDVGRDTEMKFFGFLHESKTSACNVLLGFILFISAPGCLILWKREERISERENESFVSVSTWITTKASCPPFPASRTSSENKTSGKKVNHSTLNFITEKIFKKSSIKGHSFKKHVGFEKYSKLVRFAE